MVSVVCFHVDISATRRSLHQRGPTEYGVSECDREKSEGGGLNSRCIPIREKQALSEIQFMYVRRVGIYCYRKNSREIKVSKLMTLVVCFF
jgi:hypothetical protein